MTKIQLSMTKILLILIILLSSLNASNTKNYGSATIEQVTSIYDGDTFRADIKGYPDIVGHHMAIRINGIDTPELRAPCQKEKQLAIKAKQFTVKHLREAKNIVLKNMKRGKYFRIVADVYVDEKNLGDLLLKNNLAIKYKGGKKINWCK